MHIQNIITNMPVYNDNNLPVIVLNNGNSVNCRSARPLLIGYHSQM